MANRQQLAILDRGSEAWNRWRQENEGTSVDLRDASLVGRELRGFNLSEANLRGADFTNCNLSAANFCHASLREANLMGANLREANLCGANLREAAAIGAKLTGANLAGANCSAANLREANLSNACLQETNLIAANLREIDALGSNLSGADLSNADLRGAYLIGANLSNADLIQANCTSASLREADALGTDLRGVLLRGADLSQTDFTNADLSNANLEGVQAIAADFSGATLTGACLANWTINAATCLQNAICRYVYLHGNRQERCPHDPNAEFEPGEFAQLFQPMQECLELIFQDGIDWRAFQTATAHLEERFAGKRATLRSLESRSGELVVRLNVPAATDKVAAEQVFQQDYALALTALAQEYCQERGWDDAAIAAYRLASSDLTALTALLVERAERLAVR